MALEDIIKVHIWELPEKINDIDKSNDYGIIHDGLSLKKFKMSKLYDYFNQDYKIENTVLFFDNEMDSYNKEYTIRSNDLDKSLIEYEKIVNDFKDKFNTNRTNLRNQETILNGISSSLNNTHQFFLDINKQCKTLSSYFKDFNTEMDSIKLENKNDYNDIENVSNIVSSINESYDELENNSNDMKVQMNDTETELENNICDKKEELKKSIDDGYNKIMNIISYYHQAGDDI